MNFDQLTVKKSGNEQPPVPQEQETQEDKDKKIAENLQLKLEQLDDFEPSGDIVTDFNGLLELTGRDHLYKKVTSSEDPLVILAELVGIRATWQETIRDPSNVDTVNEAKKLFYIDVPQAEIETINKLISFYLDKFSKEKKLRENEADSDFEEYKKSL